MLIKNLQNWPQYTDHIGSDMISYAKCFFKINIIL